MMHVHLIGAGDVESKGKASFLKSGLPQRLRKWRAGPTSAQKGDSIKAAKVRFARIICTDIYPPEPEEQHDEMPSDNIPRFPPPSAAERIARVKKGRIGVVLSGPRDASDDSSLFMCTARPLVRSSTFPRSGRASASSSAASGRSGENMAEPNTGDELSTGEVEVYVSANFQGKGEEGSGNGQRQGDEESGNEHEEAWRHQPSGEERVADNRADGDGGICNQVPLRDAADKYFTPGTHLSWPKGRVLDTCPSNSSDSEASAAGTEDRFKRMPSGSGTYDGTSMETCTESDWSTHGSLSEDWSAHGFPCEEAKEAAGGVLHGRTPLALIVQHKQVQPAAAATYLGGAKQGNTLPDTLASMEVQS